ncbi:LOW QUALITY PROTEIN: high mobility group protein B3 [Mauremys mutica]|uniref:High mobility group protein B3 n=8 Tax=Amniota TaxID=32524 RepID=A0A4D9EXN2_9SAUR|nr:high mobility group protein B3 [Chrysemys picta bellii]XP_034637853.1 high mobility group protein B3 [Trachemys scripta elegans]XP_044886527.1 LOW QUALITY PROTEIN: high mobility group protein B3 [Mauremys mutica]TFK15427.1 spectrin beta chain, non-erythrocytic 5 [Platysternon megacephalum]
MAGRGGSFKRRSPAANQAALGGSQREAEPSSAEPSVVPCAPATAQTSEQYRDKMAKGDPKKPKGKMSAYAFFVQTCREEHKKKNPEVPVNFAEFSKKCSERWKTMSGKEKSKFDEMAKADKVRYDREMKDYGPAKGGKKKKDPNAPKRPPSGFFLFCSEFRPKIKSTNPGISIGDVAKKLGEMWNNLSDGEKQPYNNKAAKLKEKYEKDVADYKSKGKFDGAKGAAAKAARKKVEEEDEEDEDDEEEDEEDEDDE